MNDPVDPRTLIATGLEHEGRMTPGRWLNWSNASEHQVGVAPGDGQVFHIATVESFEHRDANVVGIAWLRNNARAILTGWAQALDEVATKQRGYDDLHAMLPGSGDIWSKVDRILQQAAADKSRSTAIESRAITERDALLAEVARMRPVVEAAERYIDDGPVGAGIRSAIDAYRKATP